MGYDLTSGLGSVNPYNLVNAWSAEIVPPAATLTPASLTFASTLTGLPVLRRPSRLRTQALSPSTSRAVESTLGHKSNCIQLHHHMCNHSCGWCKLHDLRYLQTSHDRHAARVAERRQQCYRFTAISGSYWNRRCIDFDHGYSRVAGLREYHFRG